MDAMIPPVPIPPPPSELRRYEATRDVRSPVNERYPANEEAQEMIFEVLDSAREDPMDRYLACERALQVFPFSVEAYNAIGEIYRQECRNLDGATAAYKRANVCGRLLWPQLEDQETISWKDRWEHRPFLQAYKGIGCTALDKGDLEQATEQFTLLLELNPTDEQGIIPLLFLALVEARENKKAFHVAKLNSNGEHKGTCWYQYGLFLIEFLKGSPTKVDQSLAGALRSNNFVAHLLMRNKDSSPPYTGGELSCRGLDEAIDYVNTSQCTWKRIPGDPIQHLRTTAARMAPKPNDGGRILFELLKKGCVVIAFERPNSSEIQYMEITSDMAYPEVRGKDMESFKVPHGMKDFEPSNELMGYRTGAGRALDFRDERGFIEFGYDSVVSVPFWHVLVTPGGVPPLLIPCFAEGCKKLTSSVCTRCSVAAYCSRECQVGDWRTRHKSMCKHYQKP